MDIQNQRFTDVSGAHGIFPWLRKSTIRWWIYKDQEFQKTCVFRVGRRIFIGIPELLKYVEGKKGL